MDELFGALLGRLRDAKARSETLVARSKVLASARALVRDPEKMLRRCAWCGRLQLGGQWVSEEEAPEFVKRLLDDRATHGICRSCLSRLEAEGQSRTAPSAVSRVRRSGNDGTE
jgi:hypothetical protein